MGKEKVVEVEKSEMEDGEVKTHTDDDIGAEEEDEEEEEEDEEVGATAGPAQKEVEEQNDRDGEADSEETMRQKKKKRKRRKKKLLLQQQKKIISKAGSKVKETETAADREVLKGSPRRKIVKEEPKDPEESKSLEDENGKMNGNGRRDGKWNKSERLASKKSPVKRQSVEEHSSKSETEDEEDKEDKVDGEENGNEDEKSEEEERMEAEKDLALTMSSSWAPLSERERESLKVSKSGREEREKETETYREVQSESFKERVRAREDDVELSKEKSRLKKQKLSDPPLLSLSLPDTSLHLASSEPSSHGTKSKSKSSGPVPKAASENERSFRSFGPTQSQSNGYTNSLSLSLSHQFFHNPSCSLTQNSFDDKEGTTCSSHQVSLLRDDPTEGSRGSSFGGREHFFHMASDGSHDRSKYRRELPLYQKLLQSGNAQSLQGAPGNGEGTRDSSRSFMDERPMEPLGNPLRDTEGSIGGNSQGSEQFRWKDEGSLASGCIERSRTSHDRPWTIHRDTRERHRQDGWSSPSQSGSVQERLYGQRKLSGRERRPDADAGRELSLSGSRGFAERDEESAGHEKGVIVVEEDSAGVNNSRKVERSWLHDIATEPIPRIASKLQEVPESFLESLKKCLQDTLGSSKRKDDFVSLQRTLQRRSDLTTDTLLQSHRTQLEILVAMKTGIPAFLHPDMPLTTAALTEIFVGTKCRNALCQSQLPADDCECKVCSSKGGFCNACMCVVCSKFDFDSNTCRWIGCDFCLHWCHSDCGIQMGHISSGVSTRGTSGDAVMQFRCIGCDHTSELYGFVKDVFTTCAKDWPMDVLARELQCVRRIFHRSEDLRGKQLFGKAEQLLAKLESSRDVEAVCQSMLKFFAAGEKEAAAPRANSGADVARDAIPLSQEREMTSRLADAVRDAIHVIKAPNGDGTDLEKARAALEFFDHEVEEKRQEASELQHERAWQRAQIEELENIVQIKQAEAKMFQMRADEVRREAEGLQRIVQAKNEKIEEEYKQKLTKLRLNESEERRHKWSDEVQTLEKTHREYSAMKMSMVSDIRELLKTVEAAKAQLS